MNHPALAFLVQESATAAEAARYAARELASPGLESFAGGHDGALLILYLLAAAVVAVAGWLLRWLAH